MNDNKHICNLVFCEQHGECFYKNEKHNTIDLNGGFECYHQDWIESLHGDSIEVPAIRRIEDSDDSCNFGQAVRAKACQPNCQNPKCHSVAETRFNGETLLCFKCVDLLRGWRTNHELGTIFKRKDKTIELLKLIDEQINQPKKEMVRCSNIYCGTIEHITRHHLVPKPFRNRQTVEKIPLCEPCHKRVHQLATNTELAKYYNTKKSVVELLANDVKFRVQRMMNVCQSENLLAVA